MMHDWNDDWGAGHWLLMSVGLVLVWALLTAAIVFLVRYASTRPAGSHQPAAPDRSGVGRRSARDILDERYARGEIGDEEYRNRRETLASG